VGGGCVAAGGAAAEEDAEPLGLHPASSAQLKSSAAARRRITGRIMTVLSMVGYDLIPHQVSGIRYASSSGRTRP
jgi:hypothetical protein